MYTEPVSHLVPPFPYSAQVFTGEVSDGNSTISGRTVGGIVGGVLVGALTIVLLSFLIALCLCHRKRRVAEEQAIKGKILIDLASYS